MAWGNPTGATAPTVEPSTVFNTERDRLLLAWNAAKDVLARAKESEIEARKAVAEYLFPDPKPGTNRVELGNGYACKLVHKVSHKIVAANDAVIEFEDKAAELGNEAPFLVERLIKWTCELSVSEYKKLDASNPCHVKVKAAIDNLIEIKPGTPTLEIEEPKAKLNG